MLEQATEAIKLGNFEQWYSSLSDNERELFNVEFELALTSVIEFAKNAIDSLSEILPAIIIAGFMNLPNDVQRQVLQAALQGSEKIDNEKWFFDGQVEIAQ